MRPHLSLFRRSALGAALAVPIAATISVSPVQAMAVADATTNVDTAQTVDVRDLGAWGTKPQTRDEALSRFAAGESPAGLAIDSFGLQFRRVSADYYEVLPPVPTAGPSPADSISGGCIPFPVPIPPKCDWTWNLFDSPYASWSPPGKNLPYATVGTTLGNYTWQVSCWGACTEHAFGDDSVYWSDGIDPPQPGDAPTSLELAESWTVSGCNAGGGYGGASASTEFHGGDPASFDHVDQPAFDNGQNWSYDHGVDSADGGITWTSLCFIGLHQHVTGTVHFPGASKSVLANYDYGL